MNSHEPDLPQKSIRTAYGLLLIGSFYGVHRFYFGKWRSGLLIPTALVVALIVAGAISDVAGYEDFILAPLFLWLGILLWDGWFIRSWVKSHNQEVVEDYALHPDRYLIGDSEHIAPWARGRAKEANLGYFATNLRWSRNYFFFLFLPALTGLAASEYQSLELLMIPIVLLVAIGLIGSLDKTIARYPTLMEIPGVGQSLERVAAMRALYWENEPNVLGAFKGLFFQARKQYKVYWIIASVVMATVVINGVLSYKVNTDYIEPLMGIQIVGITAVLAAVVVLINLVPITALSFHYSLSGKTTRLAFMTVMAITATILGYLGDSLYNEKKFDGNGTVPSYLSAERLHQRMGDEDYRSQLMKKMEFFLGYYMDHPIKESEMASVFVDLLNTLAPNDESKAFGIIVEESWMGIVYHHNEGFCYSRSELEYVEESGKVERVQPRQIKFSSVPGVDGPEPIYVPVEGQPDSEIHFSWPFSILAIAYRPSAEEEEAEIQGLIEEGALTPREIVKYMDEKISYYRWNEHLDLVLGEVIPDGCKKLMYDHNFHTP